MAPWILDALTDTALRTPEGEDVYAIEELFSTLTASIFSELDAIKEGDEFSVREPMVLAQRRVLQEYYFRLLAFYASGDRTAFSPDINSSRALARQELVKIERKLHGALNAPNVRRDAGSVAHLSMLQDRVKRLLEASLLLGRP